jgi:hypothetical protein
VFHDRDRRFAHIIISGRGAAGSDLTCLSPAFCDIPQPKEAPPADGGSRGRKSDVPTGIYGTKLLLHHLALAHLKINRSYSMAKDEHNKAAEHHENAAKSHRAAAEHHGKNDHAKGKEHSASAQQHSQNARQHSEQAHSKSQQQK